MLGFETARLRMRPLDEADEALYCGLYTDAETMRFICEPLTPERALRTFRKAILRPRPAAGPFLFSMTDKANLQVIGVCATVQVNASDARAEVGMMLKPECRIRGYATDALAVLTMAAFSTFSIDRVWVQYAPAHVAAERLVIKLGFAPWQGGEIRESRSSNRIWVVERSQVFTNITNEGSGDAKFSWIS